MHGRRLAFVTLLLAGLLSAGPQTSRGQTVPANWEHAAPSRSAETAEIAILGQIARPGLYQVSTSSPTLLDMIRIAGGLTSQASGNIRVVRNGQVAHHVFVSPTRRRAVFGGDLKAASGDVILVERTVTKEGTLRTVGHSSDRPAGVQLALVNLSATPGVVRISPEHATVPGVLRLINHPVDLTPTVRVLRAGGDDVPATDSETLPSGSVLIFDPSVIEIDKVPPLPAPTVADVPRPIPAERHAGDEFIGEEVEIPPPFPTPVDEPRVAEVPAHRGPAVELLEAPPDEADRPLRVAERPSVPQPVDVPWQSHIDSGPYGSAGAPLAALDSDFGPGDASTASNDERSPTDGTKELTAETAGGGFNGASLAAVLVLSGLTLVAVARIRAGIKSSQAKSPAAVRSARQPASNALAALISNQLPLDELSFDVPARMSFSRRLGGNRPLRADSAQSLAAPHFPVTAAAPRREEPVAARSENTPRGPSHRIDGAAPVAGPVKSRVAAPTQKGTGLLDRVLAAVNQERRS